MISTAKNQSDAKKGTMGVIETVCPWCHSGQADTLLKQGDLMTGRPGSFQLVQCLECGLIRQNPRLEWKYLQAYYASDYNPYETIIEQETNPIKRLIRRYGMWKRFKSIERFVTGGKILDVGCGTGIFLAEASRRPNWDPVGLEPNEHATTYIKSVLEIPIYQDRIENLDFEEPGFDVITLWNVLEHLEDPIQSLRKFKGLLKKDGLLVMTIPNLSSWEAKLFGEYWIGWDQPRHLHLFPLSTLHQILEAMDYQVVDVRCVAAAHAAFGQSLMLWLDGIFPSASRLKTFTLRLFHSFPLKILLSLPFWISDRFKASTLITVFAAHVD